MLNVLAVAGFMTFWSKCNTAARISSSISVKDTGTLQHQHQQQHHGQEVLETPDDAAAGRTRPLVSSLGTNGSITAQGPSISHEVLLRRLGSLEDVVYRQLNGMAIKEKIYSIPNPVHCLVSL